MLIGLILVLSLGYSRYDRIRSIPHMFKYLPTDMSVFALSSSFETLWSGLEPHFGKELNETRRSLEKDDEQIDPSKIKELLGSILELHSMLKDKGIKINSPQDLADFGLNPAQGFLFSISGPLEEFLSNLEEVPAVSIVLPVSNPLKFEDLLKKLEILETDKPSVKRVPDLKNPFTATQISEDFFIVYPESGIAVVSNRMELMGRILDNPKENFDFFTNNDALVRSLNSQVPARVKSDGWVRIYAHSAAIPFISRVMATLKFHRNHILLNADFGIDPCKVKAVNRLTSSKGLFKRLESRIPVKSGFSVNISDSNLLYYKDLLMKYGDRSVRDTIRNFFHGILNDTKEIHSIEEMGLFAVGTRGLIPDMGMVLKISETDAENFVFELQKRFRIVRDKKILTAAIKSYQTGNDADISDLISAGRLSEKKQPLWHRYRMDSGKMIAGQFEKSDFNGQTYQFQESGYSFAFLYPPMTRDDFTYLSEEYDMDQIDTKALLNDGYRLCSVYYKDQLLIGTDAETLKKLINENYGEINKPDLPAIYRLSGHGRFKASVYCSPKWIIDQGLLNPDKDLQSMIRQNLIDLGKYRHLLLLFSTKDSKNEISVSAVIRK
ncbi:hypothetical protein [Desulfospira joergensenii]|uniref:hypothetical protein n=1 Tax=Desulfospira joergensenii TaxID=53329 RepID=UPI001294676F|nr:hypothetical protein [Desulfospira joergensenii]